MLTRTRVISLLAAMILVVFPIRLMAQQVNHQHYRVVVLPPDGGADSIFAGYLFYGPLTDHGTIGVYGDTNTSSFNSYTWTNGRQVDLQPLPQLPNLTGTSTFINWINEFALSAGYGTRVDSATQLPVDNAAIWTPDGHIFQLSTPQGDQSHAVWINHFGDVSGWIENATVDHCAFGVGVQDQSQAVMWHLGRMIPLGTLGGTTSYGEFINDLGQVSGHSETSNTPDPHTGCPPVDPFVWENGKMIDINPGNFGGTIGGTNFLSNHGQAVGFGTVSMDAGSHAFLWSQGELTDLTNLGTLGGPSNAAFNVNELGHVTGASATTGGALLAVLWRNGEFINLSSLTADGDDCSEPARINSRDQIVGNSFSCETGEQHAFLWENGEMVNLNSLIPSTSGLELIGAGWINESGTIVAQAILTAGVNSGAQRAVLLFPDGKYQGDGGVASSSGADNAAISAVNQTTATTLRTTPFFMAEDGRVDPRFLQPFSPAMLKSEAPN